MLILSFIKIILSVFVTARCTICGTAFALSSEILVEKSLSVVEKLHFVRCQLAAENPGRQLRLAARGDFLVPVTRTVHGQSANGPRSFAVAGPSHGTVWLYRYAAATFHPHSVVS